MVRPDGLRCAEWEGLRALILAFDVDMGDDVGAAWQYGRRFAQIDEWKTEIFIRWRAFLVGIPLV